MTISEHSCPVSSSSGRLINYVAGYDRFAHFSPVRIRSESTTSIHHRRDLTMRLLELFCDVDDFPLSFAPHWKASQLQAGKQRERASQLCLSEVITILIHFHQSHYRTFKSYYTEHVQVHLTNEFPHLVSYQRFVALILRMMLPMLAYLQSWFGAYTGISFIDSTSLQVCHPKRIRGTPRLCGGCQAWQNEHGLVLWLQAAPGRQRSGGTARLLFDPRQCR